MTKFERFATWCLMACMAAISLLFVSMCLWGVIGILRYLWPSPL